MTRVHISVPVAEVRATAAVDERAFLAAHTFIVGRCGKRRCAVHTGANRDVFNLTSAILGDGNHVVALQALLYPIVDAIRDDSHYAPLPTAITHCERRAALPNDVMPLRLIKMYVKNATDSARIASTTLRWRSWQSDVACHSWQAICQRCVSTWAPLRRSHWLTRQPRSITMVTSECCADTPQSRRMANNN